MANSTDYIRLIVSDTHLGSAYSKEKQLLKLLKTTNFDELILAGDIIEFLRRPEFTLESLEVIRYVLKTNKKVVYVVGNHDDAFERFSGKTISGITFTRSYDFNYNSRNFRVQHGDQYDSGIVKWRYGIQFVSLIQDMIERILKIDITTWWANRQLKKRTLKRIWDLVKWNESADVFIMGHTHNPEVLIWVDKNEKIKTYVNTGDWVDNCTYVIVKDGQVRLRKWDNKLV